MKRWTIYSLRQQFAPRVALREATWGIHFITKYRHRASIFKFLPFNIEMIQNSAWLLLLSINRYVAAFPIRISIPISNSYTFVVFLAPIDGIAFLCIMDVPHCYFYCFCLWYCILAYCYDLSVSLQVVILLSPLQLLFKSFTHS